MAELLLELFSEEIPARMQRRAGADLLAAVTAGLKAAGLESDAADAYTTPRRLALVIGGLPMAQPDVREEKRGPRTDAPEKAIAGFLRANKIAREACEERETEKGTFLFAVIERQGRPTAEVLVELLGEAIAGLAWPKSMRWGAGQARWVRPLHSLLCLFDGAVVPVEFAGLTAGNRTEGHRFHAPGRFEASGFADYREKLETARVLLDPAERRARIESGAEALAEADGLSLVPDNGLLDELAGLVEWPVPLLGRMDPRFLELPPEVLVSAMRTHQRYLALNDKDGTLAPAFIAVANLEASDGGAAVAAGNERVLTARLSDAEFFWQSDLKTRLEDRLPALDDMVFHAKLGSLGDKVTRIQALAGELAEYIPGAEADHCRAAAMLAKADLTSDMVGEFPELQGLMGRYYAEAQGERTEVARAIAEHYAPQGPGDVCPTAPTSVAVALADKIDTMVGFFAIGETPTGSRDPFALRRAALGVIRIVLENDLRLPLASVFKNAGATYAERRDGDDWETVTDDLLAFAADRLKVHLRGEGVRHDLISAAFSLKEDDLVHLMARVRALETFLASSDGENLLTAFRRANNIVRIEEGKDGARFDGADVRPELLKEKAEQDLDRKLDLVRQKVIEARDDGRHEDAYKAFAELRAPVDEFFESVTVNANEPELRQNRLRFLDRVRTDFLMLADFSQIEG